jgi:DNA-binding winged helix-turn-helix (wHTH) protein/predicted ATPase
MQDSPAAVRLDATNACLWRGAEAIRLTPQAWAVLAVLIDRAGQLVTKEALFETAWPDTVVSEAALVVCIRKIRQALGDTARTPQYVETVHRRGYRFIGPLARPEPGPAPGRPAAPAPAAVPPGAAVGREAELGTLHGWLAQARRGERCVGFVTGEAGIGKTTLVDAFLAQATVDGALWLGRGQCVEQYGAGEAYLPVLEALGQLCRGPESGQLLALLEQQAPLWLLQLPAVLRAPAREALQRQVQGATPERMLRECAEAVEALTAVRPLVLVLEDLHWSDQATLALVAYLAQRRAPARLLLIGTYRPVEVIVHGHPLQALKTALTLHGHCVELVLEVLPAAAVAAVVAARLPGQAVPPAVVTALHRRTDGHPLFLVQLVEALRRQGALVEVEGRWELPGGLAALDALVPESLRQLIEQHCDRLSAEHQRLLEAASVAGLAWPVAAVAAAVAAEVEQVEAWCEALVRQGQLVPGRALVAWPDGTVGGSYQFRHALYHQVVYDRVPMGRRARLHQRLGLRVEAGYGAQAQEVAAELAMHFERGHDLARAVQYRQQAAAQAVGRYAYAEAIAHLTRGLALLQTLPESPARTRQELEMVMALGPAFVATKGYAAPEVEHTYTRAQALCQQVGETAQLFPMLRGLCMFSYGRGALPTARELGEQLCRLAPHAAGPAPLLEAQGILGYTLLLLGDYTTAWQHLEPGLAQTTLTAQRPLALHYGVASGVRCLSYAALTLWCLGYPAQAVRRSQEACTLAQALAHPYSLAFAHFYAAFLQYLLRDAAAVQGQADALLTLATAQAFQLWVGYATCWRSWAGAVHGQDAVALEAMDQGIATVLDTGMELSRSFCLVLRAEAAGHAGRVEEGLRLLAAALSAFEATERGDLLAEAYRLRGELLLRQAVPDGHQAEACFQQARTVAHRQQAKSWELRAAMSLSHLWQQQGKQAEARALLAPIYGWFTEGFETVDLQEAKALLEELATSPLSSHP